MRACRLCCQVASKLPALGLKSTVGKILWLDEEGRRRHESASIPQAPHLSPLPRACPLDHRLCSRRKRGKRFEGKLGEQRTHVGLSACPCRRRPHREKKLAPTLGSISGISARYDPSASLCYFRGARAFPPFLPSLTLLPLSARASRPGRTACRLLRCPTSLAQVRSQR